MERPTMIGAQEIAPDLYELAAYLPVPGQGVLPVNAFVVRGEQPMLIDTGLAALHDDFMDALGGVIAAADLRWIWISHMDPDHIGNLAAVMERSPQAQVVTSFLGMGKMMLLGLPVDRVHLLAPGQSLDLGGRTITAVRPPYYDAPETMGLFDGGSRALFVADAFGALLPQPVDDARSLAPDLLREGLLSWSAVDAPWLRSIDSDKLRQTLRAVERLDPALILSAHLPHARDLTHELVNHATSAAEHHLAADQEEGALERLLANA